MYTKPLSYSSVKLFRECPKRWEARYIFKKKERTGPAAQRGIDIHANIENYFLSKKAMPPLLKPWTPYMDSLLAREGVQPEVELAVTSTWEPTTFADPDGFFRGKVDLLVPDNDVLEVYDWKTGRYYPEHEGQAQAYTALAPPATDYIIRFAYLDDPLVVREYVYTAEQRAEFVEKITAEVNSIREAASYAPKPSDKCKWCDMSWRKGGDCRAAP